MTKSLSETLSGSHRTLSSSLSEVFDSAGLAFLNDAGNVSLDFRVMDDEPTRSRRLDLLRTSAGLLMRLERTENVVAHLPRRVAGQRALAATGVMFALAELEATFEFDEPTPSASGQLAMSDDAPMRALVSKSAWQRDFSPAARNVRDALFAHTGDTDAPRLHRAATISDDEFVAIVNFHRVQSATLVAEMRRAVSPWLRQRTPHDPARGEDEHSSRRLRAEDIERLLQVIDEAVENVVLHAFGSDLSPRRSLLTVERLHHGSGDSLRVQVLDNGAGIPATLGPKLGAPATSVREAQRLVDQLMNSLGEPTLRGGRGLGIQHMCDLAGELNATLTLTTAGPDDTQITLRCRDGAPAMSTSDLIPIAGTIVTLLVPVGA